MGLKSLGGLNSKVYRDIGEALLNARFGLLVVIGPSEMDPSKGSYFSKLENFEEVIFNENEGTPAQQAAAKLYNKWFRAQPHL